MLSRESAVIFLSVLAAAILTALLSVTTEAPTWVEVVVLIVVGVVVPRAINAHLDRRTES